MKCAEIQETMLDLAMGSEEPSAALREHMQTCAACTAQLQEFRQTMALLDEWKAPEPSQYFDTRLQARLREEKALEGARGSRGWFAWLPTPLLAMSAALLLAVGVGVITVARQGDMGQPTTINQASNSGNGTTSNGTTLQRGTAVADLQTLDSDEDLYANFDVLDDIDSHQNQQPASE